MGGNEAVGRVRDDRLDQIFKYIIVIREKIREDLRRLKPELLVWRTFLLKILKFDWPTLLTIYFFTDSERQNIYFPSALLNNNL